MAWDNDKLRLEILGEFVDATAWSTHDATKISAQLYAKRKAADAERSRNYYKNNIKADPEALERYRERKRLDMQRRRGMRERLPIDRNGVTHHFSIIAKCNKLKCVAGKIEDRDQACTRCGGAGVREVDGYLTLNTYPDGRLAEIFLRIGKTGAEEGMYDEWAKLASGALQFGMPVEAIYKLHHATCFEPSGATKNEKIPRVTSVLDYVVRFIKSRFEDKKEVEVQP